MLTGKSGWLPARGPRTLGGKPSVPAFAGLKAAGVVKLSFRACRPFFEYRRSGEDYRQPFVSRTKQADSPRCFEMPPLGRPDFNVG